MHAISSASTREFLWDRFGTIDKGRHMITANSLSWYVMRLGLHCSICTEYKVTIECVVMLYEVWKEYPTARNEITKFILEEECNGMNSDLVLGFLQDTFVESSILHIEKMRMILSDVLSIWDCLRELNTKCEITHREYELRFGSGCSYSDNCDNCDSVYNIKYRALEKIKNLKPYFGITVKIAIMEYLKGDPDMRSKIEKDLPNLL